MNRLFALPLLLLSLISCSLLDEDTPNPNPGNNTPTVTLTVSPPSGAAPLEVTFTAVGNDVDGDDLSYSWNLAGAANAPTVSQTFTEAGSYPVTVTVSDGQTSGSASTTVTVTAEGPVDPEPPTDPEPGEPSLSVTASPGGAAPWAVRYDIEATGFPAGSTYEIGCRLVYDDIDTPTVPVDNRIDDNTFACFYAGATGNDEGFVRVLPAGGGEPLAQVALDPRLTGNASPIFEGTWRYSYSYADGSPTRTGPFVINQGDSVTGSSEDGFSFGLYEYRTDTAIEYVDTGSQTASTFLIPDPQADGTQRYLDGMERTDGVTIVLERVN